MADSYDFDIDAYCTVCERVISSRYVAPPPPPSAPPVDSNHAVESTSSFAPASHTSSTSAGSRTMRRTASNKRIALPKPRRRSHVNVAALGRTAKATARSGNAPKKASTTSAREEIIEVIDDDPAEEPLQAGLYCSDECRLIDEARSGLSPVASSDGSSDGFTGRRRRSTVRFSPPDNLPPIPSAAPSAAPTAAIDQHVEASAFPFPSTPLDFGARRHSTRAYRPTLIERTSSEAYSASEVGSGFASGLSKSMPRSAAFGAQSLSASEARPKSPRSRPPPLSRSAASSSMLSSRPPPFFIGSAPSSRGPLTSRSSASLALLGTSYDSPRTGSLISLSGFVARGEILPASASTAATVTFAAADSPSSPSSYAPSVFSERSTAFTASSDRLSTSLSFSREPAHKIGEPPPRVSGLAAGLATAREGISKFYL